jgi:hypothetical protein
VKSLKGRTKKGHHAGRKNFSLGFRPNIRPSGFAMGRISLDREAVLI